MYFASAVDFSYSNFYKLEPYAESVYNQNGSEGAAMETRHRLP